MDEVKLVNFFRCFVLRVGVLVGRRGGERFLIGGQKGDGDLFAEDFLFLRFKFPPQRDQKNQGSMSM